MLHASQQPGLLHSVRIRPMGLTPVLVGLSQPEAAPLEELQLSEYTGGLLSCVQHGTVNTPCFFFGRLHNYAD